MAWTLQSQMESYIAPSIQYHLDSKFGDDDEAANDWLVEMLESQGSEVEMGSSAGALSSEYLIRELAEGCVEIGTTTIGGDEFHLDDDGCSSLPWCEEDYMLEYYG